jgi:glyoxylase-like metal-dependent hydrolase (beta-lactamase superfamily II)/8-oxo-dGTP pyrophosphatase MutT (NUDIX family)
LPDGRVLVGARTLHARSWPGTLAFPGGGCEDSDDALPLASLPTPGRGDRSRACALRELGEETGMWLLCRAGGAPASDEARARFAQALVSERLPIARALSDSALVLDDRALVPLVLWRTWDGRFTVQQFLLPLDEVPPALPVLLDELTDLQWRLPSDLRRAWREGAAFLIAPIRRVVVELARQEKLGADEASIVRALSAEPNAPERARSDLCEGVCIVSARSPTLPPATHTNAVLLGSGDALLVDPATPWPDEQERFDRHVQASLGPHRVAAIVCTHHHIDHVGDVARLKKKLAVPVWAHRETQARVDFAVDRLLDDGEVLVCPGDPERRFRVVFTPGHARGHICLFEESTRLLVAGDMVAGVGSILIDPPEGHMGTYLASLERLIALEPGGLVPSHGPLLVDGKARLQQQLAHRALRQAAIEGKLGASGVTGLTVRAIVDAVYGSDTPSSMLPFAERSVLAALELAAERGLARERDGAWYAAPSR